LECRSQPYSTGASSSSFSLKRALASLSSPYPSSQNISPGRVHLRPFTVPPPVTRAVESCDSSPDFDMAVDERAEDHGSSRPHTLDEMWAHLAARWNIVLISP
jgi:hypothetical protein